MNENNVLDFNIFMMCEKINNDALTDIPKGYHIRTCRKDELDIWYEFPFENENDKKEYVGYMKEYFNNVYKPYGDKFFEVCLFLCDENDKPVATCFAWKSYDQFYTIHWLKVLKGIESKGLGRAILSEVMKSIPSNEYPIYLHTQPGSFRAIKLYSDFGFSILTDEYIGDRKNQINESLEYLQNVMGDENFKKLTFKKSDGRFSKEISNYKTHQF